MMEKRIGHYKIISELGRGGMGVVYKAHEESLNRFVAIKVLGDHLAQDPAYVARFLREAQSAARLTHPNLVHIHLVGEDQGRHYFVMEFVTGLSLQQRLKNEPQMSAQDAGRLVLQAAAGLAAAHDVGIIHRDIKPANLLIDERGLLKIADFGLALMREVINRLTATGMVMGTPGYLAPEQCMEMEVDHRTDIYSLGVTFYEMLAGRMPFEASSPLALLRMILDVEPPDLHDLNPNVDSGTRAILARMMVKNREDRYASCHELIVDLQAHLDQLMATGVSPGTRPTTPFGADSGLPLSPSKSRSFDHGVTMGATPPRSLTPPPPPSGAVPPPPAALTPAGTKAGGMVDENVVVEEAVSPQKVSTNQKKMNAAVIAIVAVVGITIGFALFAGATWWMKRGARVTQVTEKPPTIVATEIPDSDQPPVRTEVEVVIAVPTPGSVRATPKAVPTRAPEVPKPYIETATPAVAPTVPVVLVAREEPTVVPTIEAITVVQDGSDEVDEVMMQLLDDLESGDPLMERNAAKGLYRTYRENPAILETVSRVLLDGFARDRKSGNHVDAMAWLCNILGEAGDRSYAPTLRTVVNEGKGRKIKGYAKKNLKLLR